MESTDFRSKFNKTVQVCEEVAVYIVTQILDFDGQIAEPQSNISCLKFWNTGNRGVMLQLRTVTGIQLQDFIAWLTTHTIIEDPGGTEASELKT